MEKMEMQSKNLVDENISKIAQLFPNCITEGKNKEGQVVKLVDFDLLKQELSKDIVEGNDERYTLNWAGKKQAILTANSPINATLRPCREESVDFDNTKNLYIEGDNLDVLKLLRETYLGKVKMIYIDPPYNTGNDFVYEDDFATSAEDYLQASKSYDEQGNRMFQNSDSNGRFHSDWLSMMYCRIKLAKDFLSQDGVIFISIDDNEVTNLHKLCDDVFGSNNFIMQISNLSNPRGRQTTRLPFALTHEYILVYAKNINDVELFSLPYTEEQKKEYNLEDSNGRYRLLGLRKRGTASDRRDRPNLFYPIYYSIEENYLSIEKQKETMIEIVPKKEDGSDGVWRWMKTKVEQDKSLLEVKIVRGKNGEKRYDVFVKDYMQKDGEDKGSKVRSIWDDKKFNNEYGTEAVKNLFNGKKYFDFPKPVETIKETLRFGSNKDSIIMDFFSGSGTTAQSVIELNAEDGGNRKFICVQLPELLESDDFAYIDGYKTIPEIAEERIRRAGKKIKEENQMTAPNLDIGFRVLKLDSSNMKDIYYKPAELNQASLLDYVSNIKEDRTAEDLLFQVMLDMGVMLSSEIKTIDIKGKKVFNVNDCNLVCCFDNDLTDEVVTEIAKLQPLYAVFRDSSMSSDSVAVNFDQIFETYSPTTTRKVL